MPHTPPGTGRPALHPLCPQRAALPSTPRTHLLQGLVHGPGDPEVVMSPLHGSKSRVGRCTRVLSTQLHRASGSGPARTPAMPPPLSAVPAEAHQGQPGCLQLLKSHPRTRLIANAGPTQHRSGAPPLPAQDLVPSKRLPHAGGGVDDGRTPLCRLLHLCCLTTEFVPIKPSWPAQRRAPKPFHGGLSHRPVPVPVLGQHKHPDYRTPTLHRPREPEASPLPCTTVLVSHVLHHS